MASPQAVRLFEQIYAKVDAQVRDIVNSMLPNVSVAAQDDGAVVANEHRILNFQGPGVTVSEEASRRRVNVFIPGAPVAGTLTSVLSAVAAERTYNNGSSATGPSGWQTVAFNHTAAGWTASIADTNPGMPSAPTGAAYVANVTTNQADDARHLFFRSFTMPAGTATSATLQIISDNITEHVWINNVLVHSGTADATMAFVDVPTSVFIAGATNGLAIQVRNVTPPFPGFNWLRVAYRLDVNSGAADTDTRYQLLSEKNTANGYAGLDASTRVPTARLGSGTASSSTYLRGDSSWATPSGGSSSPLTTKGDVYVYGSSDTRLPVGSNNQVLTADSAQATGLKWAAAPSGSLLLFQTTLAAPAATISTGTLPSTARDLRIVIMGRGTASASNIQVLLQFNGDTAANYDFIEAQGVGTANVGGTNSAVGQTSIRAGYLTAASSPANVPGIILVDVPAYAETTFSKVLHSRDTIKIGTGVGGLVWDSHGGYWSNTAAITSILLTASSGNFATGTSVRVYGDL